MSTFDNTVTIHRAADDVFAFLADFENVPRWNYAIDQTTKTSPGPVGVGTTYRQIRSVPNRSEETFEVTSFSPDRGVAVRGVIGPFDACISYVLEPTADGTRLTNTVELDRPGPMGLFARVAGPRIRTAVARNLNELKQILESQHGVQ